MEFKKTICALAMALAVGGCGKLESPYSITGQLGGESVDFWRWRGFIGSPENYLNVVRSDETSVLYRDNHDDDLKLESVCITSVGGIEKCYFDNEIGTETLAEAQIQFDGYLTKIIDYKQQEAMKLINEENPEVDIKTK